MAGRLLPRALRIAPHRRQTRNPWALLMGMNFTSALASLNVSAILERLEEESQDVDPGYTHEVSARDYLLLVTAADQRFGGVSWGDDVPWFRGYPVEVMS